MTSPSTPPAASGASWTHQVTDKIVSTVDTVRQKATVPAQTAARALVWGIVVTTAGVLALVGLLLLALRGTIVLVGLVPFFSPDDHPGRRVWVAYLLIGVLFSAGGLVLLRKASRPAASE